MKKFQIGQVVKYTHNGLKREGIVMQVNGSLTVIETNDSASMQLWDMGYSVGTGIQPEQVIR